MIDHHTKQRQAWLRNMRHNPLQDAALVVLAALALLAFLFAV